MSLFLTSRVDFLLGEMSRHGVSKETGIPSGVLRKYTAGVGDIPDIFTKTVRSAYERIGYQKMRAQGFSSWQARRYRSYGITQRKDVRGVFEDTVAELANGYATKRVEALGLDPTEDNLKRFRSAGSRKVREGLRNSKQPFEEWVDYARK